MPVLDVSGIAKRYGPIQAVGGISFQVHAGELVGLLGPNGAGKSTALRTIAGLVHPDAGSVSIGGCDVGSRRPEALAGAGFLIEGPGLPGELTALRALAWVALLGRRPVDRGGWREVLARVGLAEAGNRRVRELSLGMRQRLAIAAALLDRPALLVLDEPMNGLDPPGVRDVGELLRTLAREGTALLVSSHLLDEVERTASRVLVMAGGRLVAEQPVDGAHAGALRELFFSVTGGVE
ncbi:MAG TPA: ABC transporter ATP-binding protein [Myxococcaceae bacterium]|nr:ABC transporter ATP-binding protein [Myxococcaceae bacterium]